MSFNLQKIISVGQIQDTDKYTIEHEPIPSIDLMERASLAFVKGIETNLQKNEHIAVVCGSGNNGGDGFAVARILLSMGFSVKTFLVEFSDHLTQDCSVNYKKLEGVISIQSSSDVPNFKEYDIIIDAIFGSGLTRPAEGIAAETILSINTAMKTVNSIDVPSGLYCDKLPDSDCIIKSSLTVSFQRPKLSFFFPECDEFVNEWKAVDIGLSETFIQSQESNNFVLDDRIREIVKPRDKHSHKGTYGHALLIAGSHGKMGAAELAAKACLRSGVGLLTTYIPNAGYEIMQVAVPEAMCLSDKNEMHITSIPDTNTFNTIGIGPGIGKNEATKDAVRQLLSSVEHPIVIDADALNILSEDKELLNMLPENSILTPHPKEFERLVGKWENTLECLEKQIQFSKEHRCIMVLKGANTRICAPNGEIYFNTSGNPGMATGGSGDVLTGIITGLLSQGYRSLEAALVGVYYHGVSGDQAARIKGESAVVASDLIDCLRIER